MCEDGEALVGSEAQRLTALLLFPLCQGGARISLMDATLTEDITEGSDEESTGELLRIII